MTNISQIAGAIDGSIDAQLIATLAGLTLIAAIFSPVTQSAIREQGALLTDLEKKIETAGNRAFDPSDTPVKREAERLNKSISLMAGTSKSLVRAFLILICLLAYGVTIDPIISANSALIRGNLGTETLPGIEAAVSLLLLGRAMLLLWKGAQGIGAAFDVSIQDELRQVQGRGA